MQKRCVVEFWQGEVGRSAFLVEKKRFTVSLVKRNYFTNIYWKVPKKLVRLYNASDVYLYDRGEWLKAVAYDPKKLICIFLPSAPWERQRQDYKTSFSVRKTINVKRF